MAKKAKPAISFGDVLRARGGDGRGPWEMERFFNFFTGYTGEVEQAHEQRMHYGNEKRRIRHRLKEIGRYMVGKTWVGPRPTGEELEWYEWETDRVDRRRDLLRRAKSPDMLAKPKEEECSSSEDDEEPLVMRRRKRARLSPPPPPPAPPAPPADLVEDEQYQQHTMMPEDLGIIEYDGGDYGTSEDDLDIVELTVKEEGGL